jgi:anti-sigma factor RsiW/cytoskeletal protein CcmA (bactofilin family)
VKKENEVTCLTEFTCAVYADGELQVEESRRVEKHLAACRSCRESVEALRMENRVLIDCFQDVDFIDFELEDETLSAPRAHTLSAARLVMFVLAMAVLLRPAGSALAALELPYSLGWLNPLSAVRQVHWLFASVMYGIPALLSMVDAFLRTATVVVFSCLLLLAILLLFRRSALSSALFSAVALLTVFSSSSYAIEVRRGDQPVTVPAGETIDDTLVVMSDSVTVDGTVNGNLIAFTEQVRIRGTVKGNVISFADRIEVEGAVEGSVLACGGWIENRGRIAHDLYSLGGRVSVTEAAQIDGNATFLAGESTIGGTIAKDVMAISARSTGFGPFRLFGRGGVFQLTDTARVGRNLSVRVDSEENARIDSGASIGGNTSVRVTPPRPGRYSNARFYFWQTIWLAAALVTGMIAFWLMPALGQVNLETSKALLTSAGIGFLALVATPVAAIIAMITLIGLPLGLIALAGWAVACYVAKIIVAGFLGRSILAKQGTAPVAALALLAGLIPIFVGVNLPYVGMLINLLITVLGLGALVLTVYRSRLSALQV